MNPAADTIPNHTPEARESAPYGSACSGCSKAKCKCILRGEGLSCERCHRLRKQCLPSAVVRKRATKKKSNRRTAHLEEKLDDLVTLLKSQAGDSHDLPYRAATTSSSASRGQNSPHDAPQGVEATPSTSTKTPGTRAQAEYETNGEQPPASCESSIPQDPESLCAEPSKVHAEQYLHTFRNNHLRVFPYLYIPPETTPEDLKRDRPLLWMVIRGNCCKSTAQQRALEVKTREYIAKAMLVDLDRSMDLLLGIIAYLAWSPEKYGGKPLLHSFANIAQGLLFDLKLENDTQEYPCRESNTFKAYSTPVKQVIRTDTRTNEERRAILGCFIVCMNISWFLKSRHARWTNHMESCLRDLQQHPEAPGDQFLVATARLLRLIGEVATISMKQAADTASGEFQPPDAALVKALRTNLEDIKLTTPEHVVYDRIIISYTSVAEACINELPLYPLPLNYMPSPNFDRTETFYNCLRAMRLCIENLLSHNPEDIFYHPMGIHLHFARCTHILYRLSLMDDPAWDRTAIYNTVDILDCLERYASLYERLPAAIGLVSNGDSIFVLSSGVLRAAKATWKAPLEEVGAIPNLSATQTDPVATTAPHLMGQDVMMPTDWNSEMWFTEFTMFDAY